MIPRALSSALTCAAVITIFSMSLSLLSGGLAAPDTLQSTDSGDGCKAPLSLFRSFLGTTRNHTGFRALAAARAAAPSHEVAQCHPESPPPGVADERERESPVLPHPHRANERHGHSVAELEFGPSLEPPPGDVRGDRRDPA